MSCARSLTLVFSDNGRFVDFRFAFVLADLRCSHQRYFERLVLLPIRWPSYCQLFISVQPLSLIDSLRPICLKLFYYLCHFSRMSSHFLINVPCLARPFDREILCCDGKIL